MSVRAQLSSDIGLFLVERLLQYPGSANVDPYPIIVSCRICTYLYEHEQSSSLSQPVSWPLPTNGIIQRYAPLGLLLLTQIANLHFAVVIVIITGNAHWQHRIPNGITSLETIEAQASVCLVCSFYVYDLCILVASS